MNPYLRAVATTGLQAVVNGLWAGTGGLPPARRRVARAGAVAGAWGIGSIGGWTRGDEPSQPRIRMAGPDEPDGADRPLSEEDARRMRRRTAALAAGLVVTVAVSIGRRRLEKRWIGALERRGHPHPHRALGVRMGAVTFGATLPGSLWEAYENRGN